VQAISTVTGLQAALDAKQDDWPEYATLTAFQAAIAADSVPDGADVFIVDPDS
jgi:hypothetical protein